VTTEELALVVKNLMETHDIPLGFPWDEEEYPTSVDDLMVEDPSISMEGYSEIQSLRVSFGGSDLFDVFVAKVK
jgi:hypothetical protein